MIRIAHLSNGDVRIPIHTFEALTPEALSDHIISQNQARKVLSLCLYFTVYGVVANAFYVERLILRHMYVGEVRINL